MWIFTVLFFIVAAIYLHNSHYFNVKIWGLLGKPLIKNKVKPEIGDLTYVYRDYSDDGGGIYEYKVIENINPRTKELMLRGNAMPDSIKEFFWDDSMQAWEHNRDKTLHESIRKAILSKKGWVK